MSSSEPHFGGAARMRCNMHDRLACNVGSHVPIGAGLESNANPMRMGFSGSRIDSSWRLHTAKNMLRT